ncbi:hypothetical protein B4135_3171 [Caldibacillus debilis]|uniref:Uncharacterized protein n=1 Tax=Caldibacillus debilis TaxID=301148 RepID=A0A150LHA0_9BACI|nr:hypothetical protein B4135_3171 [Caldibacillus debilis]
MNIGAGIILFLISLIVLVISLLFRKQKRKVFFAFLSIGCIFLVLSLLFLTGLYDPYADHIR